MNTYDQQREADRLWTEAWGQELAQLRLHAERETRTVAGGEAARDQAVASRYRELRSDFQHSHPGLPRAAGEPPATMPRAGVLRVAHDWALEHRKRHPEPDKDAFGTEINTWLERKRKQGMTELEGAMAWAYAAAALGYDGRYPDRPGLWGPQRGNVHAEAEAAD